MRKSPPLATGTSRLMSIQLLIVDIHSLFLTVNMCMILYVRVDESPEKVTNFQGSRQNVLKD